MGCGSSHTIEVDIAAPVGGNVTKYTPSCPQWWLQMPPKLRSQLSDDDWDTFVNGELNPRFGYQWRNTVWKTADLGKVVQLVVKDFETIGENSELLKKANVGLKVENKKLKDDKELGEMYRLTLTLYIK